MLFESKLFPLVRDHEIGVLSPGVYVNKTANSGTLVRQKRRVDGCRLLQVFVMQEVPSSALTGFSAIADFALLCFLVSNTPSFFFLFFRACIAVIPTTPRCPAVSPKFKTVGPHI